MESIILALIGMGSLRIIVRSPARPKATLDAARKAFDAYSDACVAIEPTSLDPKG